MRRQETKPATEREWQWLRSAAPVVSQVVRSAWAVYRQQGPDVPPSLDDKVDKVFEQFGRGVLTRREGEVVRLLLEGHSNISVSQRLGISPGTVRVHRQNLYEKLGIGSQSELLALFIRELRTAEKVQPA
ncbi:Transcriptional regulatory protein UhpA [compost metagenome]